jgi:hypothetical protein
MLQQSDKGGQCLVTGHPIFFVLQRKRNPAIEEAESEAESLGQLRTLMKQEYFLFSFLKLTL